MSAANNSHFRPRISQIFTLASCKQGFLTFSDGFYVKIDRIDFIPICDTL